MKKQNVINKHKLFNYSTKYNEQIMKLQNSSEKYGKTPHKKVETQK